MKKIIPTLFAAALMFSSVSLLVGCTDAVPEDPEAGKKEEENKSVGDGDPDKIDEETIDPDKDNE